jgi:glucan phosphoethanolaminetransferase (alkaline phosphatase superfamily)
MKKYTLKKKFINQLNSVEFVSLIAGLVLSILFLRSVITLTSSVISNLIGYGGYEPYGRGTPNNSLAIIAGILLIFALTKCRKTWELILLAVAVTIIACGYSIYLFGIIPPN